MMRHPPRLCLSPSAAPRPIVAALAVLAVLAAGQQGCKRHEDVASASPPDPTAPSSGPAAPGAPSGAPELTAGPPGPAAGSTAGGAPSTAGGALSPAGGAPSRAGASGELAPEPSGTDGAAAASNADPAVEPSGDAAAEPGAEPSTAPVPVIDRLRTDEITHLSVVRGGTLIAAVEGPRRLQVFDGSRGRLLVERAATDEVVCGSTPVLPGGLRSLWLRAPASPGGAVRLSLFDHARDSRVFDADAPPGRSVQCAGAVDGTHAIVVTPEAARIVAVPSGAVTADVPLAAGAGSRVERVLLDERGAAFVAVLAGVPAADGDGTATVVFAWGGEGGRRLRRLGAVVEPGSLVLSPSGNLVASGGPDGAVVVHSTWTGKEVARVPGEQPLGFVDRDLSVMVRERGGAIVRWQLEELTREATVEGWPGPAAAAVSEDGLRIAVAGGSRAGGEPTARLTLYGAEGEARFDRATSLFPVEALGWSADHLQLVGPAGRRRFNRRTGDALEAEAPTVWLGALAPAARAGQLFLGPGGALIAGGGVVHLLATDASSGRLVERATLALDDTGAPAAASNPGVAVDAAWSGDDVWLLAGGLYRGEVPTGRLAQVPTPSEPPAGEAPPLHLNPAMVVRVAGRPPGAAGTVVTLVRPAAGQALVCEGLSAAGCVDVSALGAWGDEVFAAGGGTALSAGRQAVAVLSAGRLGVVSHSAFECSVRVGFAVAVAVAPDAERVAVTDGRDALLYDTHCAPAGRVVPLPQGGVALSADGLRGRSGHAGGALRFRRGNELVASDAELAPLVQRFDPGELPL